MADRLDDQGLATVFGGSGFVGRYAVAAHGPREMPVWGAVFTEEMVGRPTGVYEAIARSRALADYLRSIQVPE